MVGHWVKPAAVAGVCEWAAAARTTTTVPHDQKEPMTRLHHAPAVSRRLIGVAAAAAALAVPAALGAPAADAAPAATAFPPLPKTTAPIAPLSVQSGATQGDGGSDLFLTPTDAGTKYATGSEIASPKGKVLWFHQAPPKDVDGDLRTQTLNGKPVLTFWEGSNFGGLSQGTDYIYNDHYQQIAKVHAGDGRATDGHEFLISPWGTAFVISYGTTTADLSSLGGASDQQVVDVVVQEINIHTGKVLWSWDPATHIPYSQSEEPLPTSASTPWDWIHINAVKVDGQDSVLIDARDTSTVYKVSLGTGDVEWQLGGKASTFAVAAAPGQTLDSAGQLFAWQHDAEQVGPDTFTIFDDESAGVANTGSDALTDLPYSRIDTVVINPANGTATLVATDNQPENQLATSQGNVQPLPGGDEFVGWGILNSISEFDGSGNLLFNAAFPTGVNTYRAYLEQWHGSYTASTPAGSTHKRQG